MKKILVVEDKVDNLISTRALLSAILDDVEIITATSGREAVVKVRSDEPDLVVLNIKLPGLNGLETTKILKQDSDTSGALILLAADRKTSTEEKVTGLNYGADAIINKPFNIAELSAQINALLRIRDLEVRLMKEKEHLSESLKTTGEKLNETSSLIKSIYRSLPVGIGIIDGDTIVFMNKFFLNFTSYKRENLPLKAENIIDNWPAIKNEFLKRGDEKAFSMELNIKSSDGKSFPVLLSLGFINHDRRNKFIVNIIDIGKEAEDRKLKKILLEIHHHSNSIADESEFIKKTGEIMSDIADTNKFYIGIYNSLENVINIPYHSDPLYRIKNIRPYGNLASLVLKNRSGLILNNKEIRMLAEEHKVSEYESKAKSWMGLPLINEGKTIGLMAFQNNKNDRAFLPAHLNNLKLISTTIALILESRLKNKQLEKALKDARVSEKLKNEFLSNISHEIRTPMNAIVGFSSILYDDVPENERREYLDLIIRNSEHLLKIIDDIVDIAKIQSGDITLNRIDTDIPALLRKLLRKVEKDIELEHKDIIVSLIIPDNARSLSIKTDPFRLSQALENLLSNAVKFTPSGEIEFGFSLKKEMVEFYVKDTGIGIPADKLDTIFDKFAQIEQGHTRNFGGNGLGLSITKSLINLLNGKISVYSEENKGTEVKFTLPVEKEKFFTNGSSRKMSFSYNWENKKLLLVDDVKVNLEFLDLLLRKTKAKTILADNGKKAVDIFKKDTSIDLVIMDLQMPVMDGYTATRLIKEIKPDVPVIVQTAYSELSDSKLARQSGCDAYMEKPIKANELLKTIARLLEN